MAMISAKVEAPFVSRLPRAELNSDTELIRKVRYQWDNAWHANEWEFAQVLDTWKMYFGAIGEQWDEEARRYKIERHMRVAQYNIIRTKMHTFTGMIAADEYDGKYDPIYGTRNSGIQALEFAYETEKELMGYADQYWQIILDGAVHVGTMEITKSYKKDYRGNIAFIRCLPARWITDPYWKTNDIYDCMLGWKQGHMTLQSLKDMAQTLPHSARFDSAYKKSLLQGVNWSEPQIDEYDSPHPTFLDSYHVIEQHEVIEIKKKRLIARNPEGDWVPFPVTESNEELEHFAMQNGITDFQDGAKVVPYHDRVSTLIRICPELWPNTVLAKGKPEIQVKGLPICQFTCDKDIAGRNMGKVNDLIDPQKDFNNAKSKRQEFLAAAQGGAVIYNRNRMPDEADQENFEKNHNDTLQSFGLDGSPKDFMARVSDKQPSPDLVRETPETFDIIDRISGVSAAMSSQTQSANEPARLFEMKLKINKIGTLPIDKRVKMMRIWMYQSYFFQAQISHAGPERQFTSRDGNQKAVLNQRLPDGTIRNKVDEIPLSSVTLSESPGNLTRQLRDKAEIAAMLEAVPKEYREAIAIMVGEAFKTMNLSEDKKEAIEQAIAIERAKARIQSMQEIAGAVAGTENANVATLQAKMTGMQLEQQLKQILGPAMGQRADAQPQAQPGQEQLPDMISKQPAQRAPSNVTPGSTEGLQPEMGPLQGLEQ